MSRESICKWVFWTLLVALNAPALAQQKAQIGPDQLLVEILEDSPVALPGLAASVWKDGREVYAGAVGYADVASKQRVTPETVFRIYSISKSLTAVATLRLAARGLLDLDAEIGGYLSDLPSGHRNITVRQLLSHRSGIRHYRNGEWLEVSNRACRNPEEAFSDFINDPLEFVPGSQTQYTSFGYVVLSAVLQAAAGKPYTQVMQEEVFTPAGMADTALEGMPIESSEMAMFYLRKEEGLDFVSTDTLNVDASCKFGGGGFLATARDLAAFGSALISGRLMSDESLKVMTRVVTPAAEDGSYPPMALGIFVEDPFPGFESAPKPRTQAFWHGGSGQGGYSVMISYPNQGIAVALIANVSASGYLIFRAHELAMRFAE